MKQAFTENKAIYLCKFIEKLSSAMTGIMYYIKLCKYYTVENKCLKHFER